MEMGANIRLETKNNGVIKALHEARVFYIEKHEEGFEFIDGCDGCFSAILTENHIYQLMRELHELVKGEINDR